MDMIFFLIIIVITIVLLVLSLTQLKRSNQLCAEDKDELLLKAVAETKEQLLHGFRDELSRAVSQIKEDIHLGQKEMRDSLTASFNELRISLDKNNKLANDLINTRLESMERFQNERLKELDKNQKESLARLDKSQNDLIQRSNEKLEHIRATVEEKLDKTLANRLGKSFETVGKQLNDVQQGLGEMKNLAKDVGGLKKVLSNVKMRGGFGEVQLQMLLESILAPEQFAANVSPKKGSRNIVEFAVKLPGNNDSIPHIWLPIDAKFPKDVYEKLQSAYEIGDATLVEAAQKELDTAIKSYAKDISGKYIEPPYTTDFAIMFLPFEGIYAEVVRKAELLDTLQRDYRIIVTGPTTLAAILNSLQIGFKTLAIQKRSSEVWQILGEVKKEFGNFGGMLTKAKTKIEGGLKDMDELVGTRTNQIIRKLKKVEIINPDPTDPGNLLPQPEEEEE